MEDIYATCQQLMDKGVTINRPPRDGHMAFIKSPDGISIELLQQGEALPPGEPWTTMSNVGSWIGPLVRRRLAGSDRVDLDAGQPLAFVVTAGNAATGQAAVLVCGVGLEGAADSGHRR